MLLSEIMAVENFLAFKKLMLKRNRELNEEAMELMAAQEAGLDPAMLQDNYGAGPSEDDEIARAIQASLQLEKQENTPAPASNNDDMDEEMRLAMEASKQQFEAEKSVTKAPEEVKSVPSAPVKKAEPKAEKPKKATPEATKPVQKVAKAEPKLEPIKAPKTLAPISSGPKAVPVTFDIKKHAEETKKKESEKKVITREEMKERMEKLKAQRDILLKKKQEALQKEWNEFDDDGKGGDSQKDRIQKGLGSLGITETSVKYKTEEEKQADKERLREQKEKEAAAAAAAKKAGTAGKASPAKAEPAEETDEMKRRRMIYNKIKKLTAEEGF